MPFNLACEAFVRIFIGSSAIAELGEVNICLNIWKIHVNCSLKKNAARNVPRLRWDYAVIHRTGAPGRNRFGAKRTRASLLRE